MLRSLSLVNLYQDRYGMIKETRPKWYCLFCDVIASRGSMGVANKISKIIQSSRLIHLNTNIMLNPGRVLESRPAEFFR